jgi:probable phosphoglycerate mutase
MTTFYLIRHASNDFLPHTLAGRKPGVVLNAAGRKEAEQLAEGLRSERFQKVFSSPLERCRETAEFVAKAQGVEVQISNALNEVDFADWTGRKIAELDTTEDWKRWNAFRSGARVPKGESILEVQARVVGFIDQLCRDFPDQRIALVSHGDPVRTALIYFLGSPPEFIRRIEIDPASVTILSIDNWDAHVLGVNLRFGAKQIRL